MVVVGAMDPYDNNDESVKTLGFVLTYRCEDVCVVLSRS